MLGPSKTRDLDRPAVVSLERLVPADHVYRHLDAALDLSVVRSWVAESYADCGRPSIDPVVFFRFHLGCPLGVVLRGHSSCVEDVVTLDIDAPPSEQQPILVRIAMATTIFHRAGSFVRLGVGSASASDRLETRPRKHRLMTVIDSPLRLGELVATLSLGIDRGLNQPMEHVIQRPLLALGMGTLLDVGASDQTVATTRVCVPGWVATPTPTSRPQASTSTSPL